MEVLLEARNMTKVIGSQTILSGVDFSVSKNECYGFLGPTGSGKTTILQLLAGGAYLSSGDYFVKGLNGRKNRKEIQSSLGVLPDHEILDPQLSVMDNLISYAKFFGVRHKPALKKARDLLRFSRLEEFAKLPIEDLRSGLTRRLELCMALVNDPDILILDEPTKGLEPIDTRWVWGALDKLKLQGMTFVLSTSQMSEAERLCDRLSIIEKGKILIEGIPHELIADNVGHNVVEFKVDLADLEYHLKKIREVFKYQVLNNRIRLFLKNQTEADKALSLVMSDDIQVRKASLDDVFIKIAGYDLRPRLKE
ncbi:MAG: ABC transporter ATP-binding protein [Pseudomonadota bacterium]